MEIQEGLYLLKCNSLVSFLAPNWKLHKLSLCIEHIVQNPRVYTEIGHESKLLQKEWEHMFEKLGLCYTELIN